MAASLWDKAVASLSEEDRHGIDFQQTDRRANLVDLITEVQRKKQDCVKRRLKYKRSNGDDVVLYDVFEKIALWLDKFKQVGDVAVQVSF